MSKRYKIVLQRVKEYPPHKDVGEPSTIGSFIVYDTQDNNKKLFVCCCVENGGPSTDIAGQDKRIMPRTYYLYWTTSSVSLPDTYSPKCISLYTDELPKFKERRIHIHKGNNAKHTKGCLLLNDIDKLDGTAENSEQAVKRFYDLVSKLGIDNFELEVKEIL